MRELYGRRKVTALFLGVILGLLLSWPLAAQPLSQVQGELTRLVAETASMEEAAAELAMRANAAKTFGNIFEIERENFELEERLRDLTETLLEKEKAFLEAKPELLDLAAKGKADAIQLLIKLEELVAQAKAKLSAAWGWSAKVEENLVARKKELLSLPRSQTACCITFDSLPLNTVYHVGNTFLDCVRMQVHPFQWSNSVWTNTGHATVVPAARAGGSGKELNTNNVNLTFDFGHPIKGLVIRFGEYGGNLNIRINGDFRNFENFKDIDGMLIGGVRVSVPTGGHGNDKGTLRLKGEINEFSLGGQELYIDDICPVD